MISKSFQASGTGDPKKNIGGFVDVDWATPEKMKNWTTSESKFLVITEAVLSFWGLLDS